MKYVLVIVTWTALQGGAPAMQEFDDYEACKSVQEVLVRKLWTTMRPGMWYADCHPKGTVK